MISGLEDTLQSMKTEECMRGVAAVQVGVETTVRRVGITQNWQKVRNKNESKTNN